MRQRDSPHSVGEALQEVLPSVAGLGDHVGVVVHLADNRLDDTVKRLSKALGEDHSATEFEESLESLLDRLQLLLTKLQ